jgi:hypothetical protein
MDFGTILLGGAALVGMLLAGALRWGGQAGFVGTGGVGTLLMVCGGLLVLAAGLVLERLRWERREGLSVPFDERFRWLDAPAAEEVHEAYVAPRTPGWVRALRPAAYVLVGLALTLGFVASGSAANPFSLVILGAYVLPALIALVRRAAGAAPRPR